ncbi:MAG TPA: L-aspartate oxidase, partial [Firmicutes bacterium]|nr:L-aspartate oxidase [Bacillota bacterium]
GGACAREVVELRAGVRVARWAMQAALLRQESRGAHYRDDFPQTDEITWRRPVVVEPTADGEGEAR